ncbi:hypothetical protein [Pseudorhodoplanes sp.]|uniref:hypothetical protein n=1 Tax=Pseudorhodoplanes sp. TaxID=1934341 RepID=UPI002C3A98D2|nr:hypothetical protein [Pseudorhodoplanes sp.]HWV51716.1 hypothetical protein [Pseudorhodoplanes sp.]
MLALAIPLSIIGLGFFCWLLYSLAIYALPFFIGLSAALYALSNAAGAAGAIVLGFVTAGFVLAIRQTAFTHARSPSFRFVLGLTFAIPAALAGYYATFGLSGLTLPSEGWRQAFALLGALAVGTTALLRLSPMPAGAEDRDPPARS